MLDELVGAPDLRQGLAILVGAEAGTLRQGHELSGEGRAAATGLTSKPDEIGIGGKTHFRSAEGTGGGINPRPSLGDDADLQRRTHYRSLSATGSCTARGWRGDRRRRRFHRCELENSAAN